MAQRWKSCGLLTLPNVCPPAATWGSLLLAKKAVRSSSNASSKQSLRPGGKLRFIIQWTPQGADFVCCAFCPLQQAQAARSSRSGDSSTVLMPLLPLLDQQFPQVKHDEDIEDDDTGI